MKPDTPPSRSRVAGVTLRVALGAVVVLAAACGQDADGAGDRQAEVADRGAEVMPFDLDATTHRFEPLDDGLLQTVVVDDPADADQVALVREHLADEAERFASGDFDDPASLAAGLTPQALKRLPLAQALLGHQRPLGLLDHHPGIQGPLQLGGQLPPLLALHGVGDGERGQVGEGHQGQLPLRGPGMDLGRERHHHPDRLLVVGNRAGQHRPQPPLERDRAELGPAGLGGQVLGVNQGLVLEGVDTGALAVLDLQLLQVVDAPVGHGDVAQQLVGVNQHEPGPIDGEQLVGGIHDPAQSLI